MRLRPRRAVPSGTGAGAHDARQEPGRLQSGHQPHLGTTSGSCKLAFLLNDRFADGTDISWIWDVDFEALAAQQSRFTRIFVSGVRADDMALRLKYAGFPAERIELVRDYEKLLGEIAADAAPAFIMPTYTAMFDLRGEIGRHTDVKAFYE